MKIVVLHNAVPENAPTDEQDVLVQVASVTHALSRLGHDPVALPLSLDLGGAMAFIQETRPALVFNLVESLGGYGRLIHVAPAVLDALKLPYTGAGTEAMLLTSDKLLCKKILDEAGIPTPSRISPQDIERAAPSGAFIVKAVWEHASVGLDESSVFSPEDAHKLHEEISRRQEQFGGEWFAEEYIDGRELNISILAGDNGPEALPPAEIRFDAYPDGKRRVVGYRAKWDEGSFEFRNTPRCFDFPGEDEPLLQRLRTIALDCWKLFGLRGYARVDFRVSSNGAPWVLEVNANPCISPDAGFIAAADRCGIGFPEVVARIIKDSEAER
jgi:D-alanine-D-alanine ligase